MSEIYILANGVMARALGEGLKAKYAVNFVGRSREKLAKLEKMGFKTMLYDEFNAENKDLILAFKPHALSEIAAKFKGKARILISILANVGFENLAQIPAQNYVLAMPNIAAKHAKSTTPFLCKENKFKDEIKAILSAFGVACELENEAQMGAAMAISACAPAFLAVVAESVANAGIYEGLKNEMSAKLTLGLFESFTELLKHEHPAIIKENICSPRGVTIKGVKILEEKAVRGAFFEAINASAKR